MSQVDNLHGSQLLCPADALQVSQQIQRVSRLLSRVASQVPLHPLLHHANQQVTRPHSQPVHPPRLLQISPARSPLVNQAHNQVVRQLDNPQASLLRFQLHSLVLLHLLNLHRTLQCSLVLNLAVFLQANLLPNLLHYRHHSPQISQVISRQATPVRVLLRNQHRNPAPFQPTNHQPSQAEFLQINLLCSLPVSLVGFHLCSRRRSRRRSPVPYHLLNRRHSHLASPVGSPVHVPLRSPASSLRVSPACNRRDSLPVSHRVNLRLTRRCSQVVLPVLNLALCHLGNQVFSRLLPRLANLP